METLTFINAAGTSVTLRCLAPSNPVSKLIDKGKSGLLSVSPSVPPLSRALSLRSQTREPLA
jgi:hypothetical protein